MEAKLSILNNRPIDEENRREMVALETIHEHPLLPSEERNEKDNEVFCKGCLQTISEHCHNSILDQPCQASEVKLPRPSKSKMQLEDGTNYPIQFPVPDESVDLISHFVKQMSLGENENPQLEINHFSHEHHLALSTLNDIDGFEICEGCIRPISSSLFYSCKDCSFFIHKCCAELPSKIQHPFHSEHPLILLHKATNEFANLFSCNACQSTSNGFAYGCASCDFYLDVFCSFLSDSLLHEAHQHPLIVRQESKYVDCNACNKASEGLLFGCATCDFNLDILCALYPGTVMHRHDNHPLKLKFLPIQTDSDEFCCQICEETLYINDSWFYHCVHCNNVFHPRCIYNEYQFIKFGGTIDLKGHPHPLSMVLKNGKDPPCCNCGIAFDGISFQCSECKYYMGDLECRLNLDGLCAQIFNIIEYDSQNE
ncbi:hypothetical protein ACH5RR_007464 [Cinchona calisaya]|uniref:DC1 domain-containing protein n=1 Tax=Cinchona calisaya TaxID=153742 RepID=A0ABD3AS69_9GENT